MAKEFKFIIADITEALLYDAKQVGVRSFTRTALTKYLYLLDYWVAKENNGKPYIGVEWKFHHYEPYSETISRNFDFLSTLPYINKVDVSREEKDFSLYSLGEYTRNKTLVSLGISNFVRDRLLQAIKTFTGDLTGLLNFVYFETEPMQGISPGDILSFEHLIKQNFKQDIKPIKVGIDNLEKADKIKGLISKIGEKWEQAQNKSPLNIAPIKDTHYLDTLDSETIIEDGNNHFGSLIFSKNH